MLREGREMERETEEGGGGMGDAHWPDALAHVWLFRSAEVNATH